MLDFARIARIREQGRQARAQAQTIIHLAQQQRSAITGDMWFCQLSRQIVIIDKGG